MVTSALDLGLITQATLIAGALILKRNPLGYRLAFPLLGIIIMLLPVITAGTIFQVRAGIQFTSGEIAGPIAGFALIGLFAVWAAAAILRRLPDKAPLDREG